MLLEICFSCNDKPVAAVTVGSMVVGGLEVAVGRVSGKKNKKCKLRKK